MLQELDENQDYVEAEDEFDINPRASAPRNDTDVQQDVEVDIFTREPSSLYGGALDEQADRAEGEGAPLLWLPAVSVEELWWCQCEYGSSSDHVEANTVKFVLFACVC